MGIRVQALRDLCHRYKAVFLLAWKNRKEMDAPIRHPHEVQFLPAALALQEAPVHPAPRVTLWLIMIFSLLALMWSMVGHMDVVAMASGKVVPDSRTKVIQPLETAAVHAIHVRDGQMVNTGEILVELDATTAEADAERLRHEYLSAHLESLRFESLLVAQQQGGQLVLAGLPGDLDQQRGLGETLWVNGVFASYQARLEQLDAMIDRREAELRTTRALLAKIQQTLPITRQREEDYRGLLDKNHVARHQYLELKASLIAQENDLIAQGERLTEIETLKIEAEREKSSFIAETRRDWLDKLNDAQRRSHTLAQELVKAESRGRFMSLTAPVDGVVQQLSIHTPGGVVTPAQVLMLIVPQEAPVEIEALLPNKDIGFVYPGQAVEVKFETFSFTRYGTIQGEVISVSRDAIQDERLGLVFGVRVKLEQDHIVVDGRSVNLSPGMAVAVEIKTNKRRIIDYFLGPLLRYADESLRER